MVKAGETVIVGETVMFGSVGDEGETCSDESGEIGYSQATRVMIEPRPPETAAAIAAQGPEMTFTASSMTMTTPARNKMMPMIAMTSRQPVKRVCW